MCVGAGPGGATTNFCGVICYHVDWWVGCRREHMYNAPVICIPAPLGAGDTGDIAGLKCRNLTSDVSRQCRGCAGVLISR